ncbi:MAG TPA: hypothetical protein VEH84_04735 [Alphaproteobacteria bacterium]|nr:hypothetical protein [Alphaproteobacteria bacterium]
MGWWQGLKAGWTSWRRARGAGRPVLTVVRFSDGTSDYFHELLGAAFAAADMPVELDFLDDVPQPRINALLDSDSLTLHWFLRNEERYTRWAPVPFGLTHGLVGRRILLIRPADQPLYDTVRTIDDFRALGRIGGFGVEWYDTKVWQANELPVLEQPGDWRVLYRMVAGGTVDYFSRAVTEIQGEAALHPELAIERHLLFHYERDQRFFLSRRHADLAPVLAEGLARLSADGTVDALIAKHYGERLSPLALDKRVLLRLRRP